MPLPPTRYIDAGPGVPLANPQTAMAEADAMSRMGETIAAVGQQGFQVAEKVRKIEEAGKMSAFFSNLDEEAAQFSNALMTRSDTEAWPTEWKEKTTEMRDRLKGLGISPEGRARAELEFGDWSSRRSIQFETQAASKAVAMGRAQAVQSMNYYASRGDLDSYRREADRALQGGILNPVEHEQALRDGETIATETALDEEIRNDPAGVLARLKDRDAFLAANPGANLNMINNAERKAQETVREKTYEDVSTIQDGIVSGDIDTPEELKAKAAHLRPMVREKLMTMMRERATDEYKARVSTPEYQSAVVGRVSEMLTGYEPTGDDFDEKFVEMDSMVRSLPPGAIKDELTRRIDAVRTGKLSEVKDHADAAMKALDDAHKEGRFMPVPSGKPERDIMPSQRAVNDGFLRNPDKLKSLGFSEKEVDTIIGDKKTTDSDRLKSFRTMWAKRSGKDVATGIVRDTADALINGKNMVENSNPELEDAAISSRVKAQEAFGAVKTKMADWLKLNPKATRQEIEDKAFELGGEGVRRSMQDADIDAPPRRGGPQGADNSTSAVPVGKDLKAIVQNFEAGGAPQGALPAPSMTDGQPEGFGGQGFQQPQGVF